ncbi:transferase, LIC12162 family protein [Leptospira bouyouniensis]|uniref:Transferase, LIC12162 family protein n=1 Tax=Leptospira bouyouniensis TaxID=2484911 RepID=A0A7I0HMG3_9LEPT|nr:LIC12162 family protein [Leptospira bouyouniensis]TGL02324.1 transferase, LIC12162 family protein [Leptospira bouyouniensis]
MNYHLITTALESTWPKEGTNVLFLGEWCKLHSKKDFWSNYNSITLPYHWDENGKLYKDYQSLKVVYEKLLIELTTHLNLIHGENQTVAYWRIIIGPWLGYFLHMLWDRYESLRIAFTNYPITSVTLVSIDEESLVPNDMNDFYRFFVSDLWNQNLYQNIISFSHSNKTIKKEESFVFPKKNLNGNKVSPKEVIKQFIYWIFGSNAKCDSYFLISDYLGIKYSFLLQLKLGQFPKRFMEEDIPEFETNQELRKKLAIDLGESSFEKIVSKLIPKQIPRSYIEGYKSLKDHPSVKRWPLQPKIIFTSNSHIGYDLFKIWMARKQQNGSQLILSQHGGHYGIGKFSFHEDHEVTTSNRYLTWGWKDRQHKNVTPSVCVKYGNQKKIKWDRDGDLLLVQNSMPRYSYWLYSSSQSSQVLAYLNDQFSFYRTLNSEIQVKSNVKLYPQDYGWEHERRWRESFPKIQILDRKSNMKQILKTTRLFISTYNATTFLESMSLDIPTLIFWNPRHWEIREDAKPYFDLLKEVGIFFETSLECANEVNHIWNDVETWWYDKKRQSRVTKFLNQYAKKSNDFITELSKSIEVSSFVSH